MTNLKNLSAVVASAVLAAVSSVACAQDDLDDLLKDLEGEKAPAAAAQQPAAEAAPVVEAAPAPAVEAEKPAEVAAPAPVVEAEKPVEVAVPAPVVEAEKPAEVAAPAPAAAEEAPAVSEKKADEVLSLLDQLDSEMKSEAKAAPAPAPAPAEAAAPAATAAVAAEAVPAQPATPLVSKIAADHPDAELIANIRATEKLRRDAYDNQAKREITDARAAMEAKEYSEAARHYGLALKYMNDSPATKEFRRECEQGVAEGLYRAGLEEYGTGRITRAKKLMEKALEMRHPKARKQLEAWNTADDPSKHRTDISEISHRRNDEDYKTKRDGNRAHLKRARQLLSQREIDQALEECEIVLTKDPYDQEALRLRRQILKKQDVILNQEFEITREGMIGEVGKKWRPVYAPNVRDLDEVSSSTLKRSIGDDPEVSREQSILRRMKEMVLPTISFKPPATIIDVVEFFRGASKDFDRPDIPIEDRGFNFQLLLPQALQTQAADENQNGDDFAAAAEGENNGLPAGLPVISPIMVNNISVYEALKLVCDGIGYKFKVQGPVVTIMPKNMSTDEMVTRSYPVMAAFFEKMDTVSSEMKELKSSGFGGGNSSNAEEDTENKERDWKGVFSELGVQWPEGSSIFYMKGTGKLRVKNTYDNLAELEKALIELNAEQKLVEIEARFVEVCQEDLNSLGFEWILNSDYTIGGGWLAQKLGLGKAAYTEGWTTSSSRTQITTDGGVTVQDATQTTMNGTGKNVWSQYDISGNRIRRGIAGLDAFGGDSGYANGNRYLSTVGNHISGQDKSTNDQFMRLNAFLGNADLSMILHMLSQRSDTDLLSAPKVLTRPGEEATIKVVTEYIYPTDYDVQLQSSSSGSSGGYGGGGGSSMILAVVEPQSFTMREVGVILDVTPTLTDDGNLIDLHLQTQVVDEPTWKNYGMKIPFSGNSNQTLLDPGAVWAATMATLKDIGYSVTQELINSTGNKIINSTEETLRASSSKVEYYDAPMEQPFFHVRSIDTSVSVYPGATIVMGGLITEARKAMDDKVPFLGDLPFIGRFFRSHSEWTNKRNLLIFVTTRLVDVRGREVTLGSGDIKDNADVKPAPDAVGN